MSKNFFKVTKSRVLSKKENLILIIMLSAGMFLTGAFGAYWFRAVNIPSNFKNFGHIFDVIFFAILTYVVWHQIINEIFNWFLAINIVKPDYVAPENNYRVAFLTAFVPGKEPYEILENTLSAMIRCDYPHDTWLLDEGDDDYAKEICRKYGVKYFSRKNKPEYNLNHGPYLAKTKGGNYNAWFNEHSKEYDFVAQLDVDFVPKINFLTKTLGYFKDPYVAFVGTPQVYGNQKDSWIARAAAEQAFGFYGITQPGLFSHDMSLFIGANHIVRVSAHNHIGGYSGHIVEDHLTGMNFYAKKWKSVYVPEILALGEGPSTWDAYFSQQMRWAYGLMNIYFTQSPKILLRMKLKHAINYFFLQQFYFDGIAQALGVILLFLYFFFGIQSASMDLAPLFYLYIPLISVQIIVTLWLQRVFIDRTNESGLLLRGRFLSLAVWPIYLLAFIGVLTGKKLTYKVTPKGGSQTKKADISLFYPHIILAEVTGMSLIASLVLGHTAIQQVFWAVLNTGAMVAIIGVAYFNHLRDALKTIIKRYYTFIKGLTNRPVVSLDNHNIRW